MNKHAAALAVVVFMSFTGGRSMAVEQPAYQVEFDSKPFQIRRYPHLVEATVQVSGTRDQAVSAGFRLLANYIFGGNRSKEKISMTAPVMQTPIPKTPIPKTPGAEPQSDAPDEPGKSAWGVTFIMPAGYSLQALPPPNDPRIHFSDTGAGRMAIISFSGFWTDTNLESHQEQLLAFLEQRHLKPISAPIYAFYDPPWTPWFLRTNEVQYRIAD